MSDNSDYNKPRTNLFELLPDVLRSDANRSAFENLFNRYLTKQETRKVAGYIGQGNPNAVVSRQIQEPTIHRQGYQLQPILHNKIGSIEWLSSWYDLLNEAERLGIDRDRQQDWLNLLVFNWAPPIDIDKLIHFRDYYWFDEDNPSSRPQYLTIRNRCTTATGIANFQQGLVDEFGATIPTIRAELADSSGSPILYDKLVVDGEFIRLFDPGFVFFYKNSTNAELNNAFWQVVESEYDEGNDETIIKINTTFTNATVDGVISQEEKLTLAQADKDCRCSGAVGWDILLWDDNPPEPLWDGDFTTFLAAISNAGPPVVGSPAPQIGELWYDTVADILYQFSSVENDWKVVFGNFSTLLGDVTGQAFWDFTPGCDDNSTIPVADQWALQNKWLHKNDVPNFSLAKQAQIPIIEYEWDLEINEWTFTKTKWKYRADPFEEFVDIDAKPELIELIPLDDWEWDLGTDEIVLAEKYGDLTDYFVPGREFRGDGVPQNFVVDFSHFATNSVGTPFQTRIRLTVTAAEAIGVGLMDAPGSPPTGPSTALRPRRSSQGDLWTGDDVHWVFVGTENTVPVVHQPANIFTEIDPTDTPTIHSSGDYEFTATFYTQESTILVDTGVTTIELTDIISGSDIPLTERALIGANDVRVYINGIRQFGNYDELTELDLATGSPIPTGLDDTFVAGIRFLPGFELTKFDVVRIEVGEASSLDFGFASVFIRTEEDDTLYSGNELVSLIEYRKEEQVKTEVNQYPLFDMYNVDGTPAFRASPLFGFLTDSEEDINANVNLRLVTDIDEQDFVFQQFLVDNDGAMFAYRDFDNRKNLYWVNPETEEVFFWDGLAWSRKTESSDHYSPAVVSAMEPGEPWDAVDDIFWYDTLADELKQFDLGTSTFVEVDAVFAQDDPTLQTIWKKGLNDELYMPEKRDWRRRSLDEYNEEMDVFVEERAEELENTGLSASEALQQATTEWFEKQSNPLSPTGIWIGDWEIPDPLYFNVSHENRRNVSFREVLTHFNAIIDEQPKVPGFIGPRSAMFHLIPTNEVNFGLGGTIKEFNHGFDTFLSSLFVNTTSPRALFQFAHDQYESLINNLKELYRRSAAELFTDTSTESLVDINAFIAEDIIEAHEQNDNFALLYGDSTTFTEVDGTNDIGIRNWIATLPYLLLLRKLQPVAHQDEDIGVNEIVHHDGHRRNYFLAEAVKEGLIQSIINTLDERTRFPGPQDPPIDTFGKTSTSLPPNDTTEFSTEFNTTISNREGVYWYHVNGPDRTLYRLTVADVGTTEPSPTLPDGTLWLDLASGAEVLRIKETDPNTGTVDWVAVDGLTPGSSPIRLHNGTNPSDLTTATVSAWQVVDLNGVLRDIVLSVEQLLFDNAPEPFQLSYDFDALKTSFPQLYEQELEEAFLAFTNENEVIAPFANDDFTLSDPFTWNYKNTPVVLPPSSINTGDETGGDWRDLYQKLYGTPFPHLEPWKLQGYDDRPTWWNEEYLNNEPKKWGNRRWKYKHGFDVVDADTANNFFAVDGDFREVFLPTFTFTIDQSPTETPATPQPHAGITWTVGVLEPIIGATTGTAGTATITLDGNHTSTFVPGLKFAVTDAAGNLKQLLTVASSAFTGPPDLDTIITVEEAVDDVTDFDNIGGTTYNPTTNQSRIRIDTTGGSPGNSINSSLANGRILYRFGMWENIRTGVIPPGRDYPNGVVGATGIPATDGVDSLPTYNYFSVNIGNETISNAGTFDSDEVFPPFWNITDTGTYFDVTFGSVIPPVFDAQLRSVYTSFGSIVSPGANFVFGDAGTIEWEWRNSSQFLYDQLSIALQLDPVRFTFNSFGTEFHTIAGLFINKRLRRVLSHTNTVFHGDIIANPPIQFDGTNQWYVNFARFIGLDISLSDFRSMWTQWTAPLTYQFASFIDTPSFELGHRSICISEFDYNIISKRSPGVEDFWLDSFEVVFLNVPPRVVRFDNDLEWSLELRTRSPVGKSVDYYDVHNYQFYADPATNICSLYTWPVRGVGVVADTFTIAGDQTFVFTSGREFEITGSVSNNGTYTTVSSVYDVVTDRTTIAVEEDVTGATIDGLITADYRQFPWQTGDKVVLSTNETLPVPLRGDNENGVFQYFVIVIDDTHFQLALTQNQALAGSEVDITTVGRGDHFVGQLATTFNTQKTNKNWRHYRVDKNTVLQFTPPHDVRGLQTVVNIINGYEEFTKDQGWRINSDNTLQDFDRPERFVSWQLELERMIDFAEGLRITKFRVADKFEATVDITTDEWEFVGPGTPQFITGDPVSVLASGNLLPPPIVKGLRYYMIRDSLTDFRLAATKADALAGIPINITSLVGVGQLFITEAANLRKDRPSFEIDPFREAVWFRPERGIVSNVLQGPVEDVFNTQLLLDQYSRAIGRNNLRVFREDKETAIRVAENIPNDVDLTSVFPSPYNFIHLAAAHLFVDTFEHVLIFNNETTEGLLLYDPFIGLNVAKFETLFNRQIEFTQRPNVGGHFLSTFFNQGAELVRNFEASAEDLRLLYDTYQVIEANPLTEFGRRSLGYEGREEYLDNINLSAKSQFAFWRGQIQNKGSVNAVTAFINSRRFIDAKVDEFWAVKLADFGSAKEKEFISMWLSTVDARSNDLRLHFVPSGGTAETGFKPIALTDTARWFNQPNQLQRLRNNGGVLYFDLKPTSMIPIAFGEEPTNPKDGDGWVEFIGSPVTEYVFRRWDSSAVVNVGSPLVLGDWSEETHGTWSAISSPVELPILRHNTKSDFLTITLDWYPEGHTVVFNPAVGTGSPLDDKKLIVDEYIPSANSIRVFKDGVELVKGEDFDEVLVPDQLISTEIEFTDSVTGSEIEVVYKTSSLKDGLHFTRVTSNIVRLNFPELVTGPGGVPPTNIRLWGFTIDEEAQNPAKIIDTKSEVVINPVQLWDPGRDLHYFNAIHIVDLQRDTDPAIYTDTPIVDQAPSPSPDFELIYNDPWNKTEVGTTWLDTSNLEYTPYYDIAAFPNLDDRSRQWGSLADFAEIKIYTWVESDVTPEEYDAAAVLEEGDASIPQAQRKAGRAKQTLFIGTGADAVRARNIVDRFDVAIDGEVSGVDTTFTLQNIVPVDEIVTAVEFADNLEDFVVTFSGHHGRRIVEGTEADIDGITYTVLSDISADDAALTTTATFSGDNSIAGSASISTTGDDDGSLDGTYFTLDVPSDTYPEADLYYVWYNTPSRSEITRVTVTADVNGSLSGKLFTINTPTQPYYVWYQVSRNESLTLDFTGVTEFTLLSGSPNQAQYFDINSTTAGYRFWFDDGALSAPASGGRTLVAVPFFPLDDDQDISDSVVVALTGADADFAGAANGGGTTPVISLTLATPGDVTDAAVSGFTTPPPTFTILVQGGVDAGDDPALGSPAPAGLEIPVAIDEDATASDVASATQAAIDAIDGFTAGLFSPTTVRITNTVAGATTDASPETSGFVIVIEQTGLGAGADPAPAGRTGLRVSIAVDATAAAVAAATRTVLNTVDNLSVEPVGVPANLIEIDADLAGSSFDAALVTVPTGSPGFALTLVDGDAPEIDDTITFFEPVDIYVNGETSSLRTPVPISGQVVVSNLNEPDRVHFIQPPVPVFDTDEEREEFITAEIEVGNLSRSIEHTVETEFDRLGIERTRYYFWVEDKSTRGDRIISPREAEEQLQRIPVPYVFFQGVQNSNPDATFGTRLLTREEETTASTGQTVITTDLPIENLTAVIVNGSTLPDIGSPGDFAFTKGARQITLTSPLTAGDEVVVQYVGVFNIPTPLPIRFTQAIIRGLRGIIEDDLRYIIRWTRDFTLRDTLETGESELQNKNFHEQWELIRREQPTTIPRRLWNRVTEAIVGFKLNDPATRVPSLERELYDAETGASTRIGLGTGQVFANSELALATILADLNNPNNDFAPVDINVFFQNNSFDTPENIIKAMDTIYNTFPFIHVNRMFFDVLLDGLSEQDKYADIFKTSMIALHGIRPFQIAGVFDD